MRWRKAQGFDLNEDGRGPMGTVTAHGDELPLVTSSQPRVTSPTQVPSPVSPQSLPSTPLTAISTSTLDDVPSLQGTSSTARTDVSSAKSSSSTSASPTRPKTSSPPETPDGDKRSSLSHSGSPLRAKAPTSPRHYSEVPSPQRTTIHIPSRPHSSGATTSPLRASPTGVQLPLSPLRLQQPLSPQRTPVSPQHTTPAASPPHSASPSRPPSTVTVVASSRPSSQHIPTSPSFTGRENGSLVVVVNGSAPSSDPPQSLGQRVVPTSHANVTTKTTIPIGNPPPQLPHPPGSGVVDSSSSCTSSSAKLLEGDQPPPSSALSSRKSRKSHSKTNSTDSRRSGAHHEKSKSVTIVVNDQHVTYSNTPSTYTTTVLPNSNGVAAVASAPNGSTGLHHHHSKVPSAGNGETVFANGHSSGPPCRGPGGEHLPGDSTRPSSSASTHAGTNKGDPDIQVRPLVGWWGEGGSAGSVLEETASSDDCHRSTLTLVHSPARTLSRAVSIILYLSGEASSAVTEDTGEAWGSVLSGVCGVILVVGAATFLRLPRLLYVYGAGTFLSAWLAVLLIVAAPLAYLEAGLSQFSSSAALAVWRLVPIARGVGWSSVVVCFYWIVIVIGYLAPLVHYILIGIESDVLRDAISDQCSESIDSNFTNNGDWAVDYFRVCVYSLPQTWEMDLDMMFTWPLPAGVAAVVIVVTFISICGTRVLASITGVMTIIAVLGSSLQLAMSLTEIFRRDVDAIWKLVQPFVIPQVDILLQPWVWCAALAHVFLSLGLGIGLLMNFSSRGAFRFTLRRHLWGLIILLAVITALVSAVIVLQLTLLADDRGLKVAQALSTVISEFNSTGNTSDLIITVVPEDVGVSIGTAVITASHLIAIFVLPYKWLQQVVSTIVYLGLWCGGVTTATICIHALIVALKDISDCLPRAVAAIILAPLILAGAVATSIKGGAAVLTLLDSSVLTPVVLWPPFTLTLAVTSVYGIHKVRKDFTFMLEATVSLLWIPIWGFFIPAALLGVVIWACVINWAEIIVADGPVWRTALIWGLRALVLLPVPITAIYVVKSQLAYGIMDKVASSLQSSREWGDWGPQDPIEHHNWRRWREDETRPITSLKRRFANRPLTYTHSTLSSESSSTLTRLRNKYQRNGTASIL
ncbi:uncharacterized protein [Macrobrachium rosenbergii]|uniref:uncharacterized protein isoform X3 n=1 Tax=Macrobrachium rosenbergii TaxID=79674 RepID=UPI0034D682E6